MEAGTKFLTMSQRILRRNAISLETEFVAVPIESAAGTELTGRTRLRMGIKITPAPPPQTVLSRNAATDVKKTKPLMVNAFARIAQKVSAPLSRETQTLYLD